MSGIPLKRSAVVLLPATEAGGGKLVAVAGSDFHHTGVVLAAALHLITDVVVALHTGHERFQLLHRHGSSLRKGRFLPSCWCCVLPNTTDLIRISTQRVAFACAL